MNACGVCRKQKLRCDGGSPACGRCARLGHQCMYEESRRRSGQRRGYVKGLETRLAQVESLLRKHELVNETSSSPATAATNGPVDEKQIPTGPIAAYGTSSFSSPSRHFLSGDPPTQDPPIAMEASNDEVAEDPFNANLSWEMIELGLEEPLPELETLEELSQIYFQKVHPSVPIIHQYRFLAALSLSPNRRPPIALRYAMWTLAASTTLTYQNLHEHFYARARKYAELAEMTGHGEKVTSYAYVQAWILIGVYELKMIYFPRAWLSTGRAVRLAQMMGMHRLDGANYDSKQTLPPPRDWIEKEERRRTFWMAFCMDRFATIGTGWPMAMEEADIHTYLPCPEEAFEQGHETTAMSLEDALRPSNAAGLSPFAGVVLVETLFGRVILHLHRPGHDDRADEVNGEFWKRHRNMDNTLLSTALYLPPHLRLPVISPKPNTIFLHINLHAASICLHQAALLKAEKHQLSSDLIAESSVRCFTAAAEITRVMRMIAHTDLTAMNPFLNFCIFVATRVFIQHVKRQPDDHETASSVRFLLSVMTVLQPLDPLAASFLVQLDVELEGTGLEAHAGDARYQPRFNKCAAELDKDEIDGFTMFKDASSSVGAGGQFEASRDGAEAVPANQIVSGLPVISPLAKQNLSTEDKSREALPYQRLPVRNIAVSNYGQPAPPKFQPCQYLGSDASPTMPIFRFDEVISPSAGEVNLTSDAIPSSSNPDIPHYAAFSTNRFSQVNPVHYPCDAPQCDSDDFGKLGVHPASSTSRSPSYLPQTPGADEANCVRGEGWDFGDLNFPNDVYEAMMYIDPAEQDQTKRE